MSIKFYSSQTPIELNQRKKLEALQALDNELHAVLGNNELISMTSASSNGQVITTIAYEEEDHFVLVERKE